MNNPYKALTNDPHHNNTLYQGIMSSYKDVVDLSTGMLREQNGKPSYGRKDGSFEHIPSTYVEGMLRKFYKLNNNATLLDVGSGLGNIVKLGNAIGFKSSGIEINTELKPWNEGLNITWGNFFEQGELMRDKDIIYMYRPLVKEKDMDKLLRHVLANTKDSVLIYIKSTHLNCSGSYTSYNKPYTGRGVLLPHMRKDKKLGVYHSTDFFKEGSYIFKDKSYYHKLWEIGLLMNKRGSYKISNS